MKRLIKENVANVNVGNALFCAPQRGALEFLFETGAGYRSTSTLKEDDWEAQSGVILFFNRGHLFRYMTMETIAYIRFV